MFCEINLVVDCESYLLLDTKGIALSCYHKG